MDGFNFIVFGDGTGLMMLFWWLLAADGQRFAVGNAGASANLTDFFCAPG